jgi:TolB protein
MRSKMVLSGIVAGVLALELATPSGPAAARSASPNGLNCHVWSPDGSRRLCDGEGGLYSVRSTDGGDAVRVTAHLPDGLDAAASYNDYGWLPDAKRIVIAAIEDRAVIATTSRVLIASQPIAATFPGKNGRIAFRRPLGPQRAAIFTINPDGSNERRLTHPTSHTWTTEPNWSADGRWIVYDLWRQANEDNARVFKILANGTHATRLDHCTAPCLTDSFPTWSPSGKRIAFGRGLGPSVGTNNVSAIFVMPVDGSNVRQITRIGDDPNTEQPYMDNDPAWSPDGGRLAFQRTRTSDNQHAIFTVRLDGTHVRRLTAWRLDCASPDWAPDGRWIAFRTDENSDTRGAIALVRPSGRHLRIITPRLPKWGLLSFSPNGHQIVASRQAADGDDLYKMSINGTNVQLVVGTDVPEGIPGWGPQPR